MRALHQLARIVVAAGLIVLPFSGVAHAAERTVVGVENGTLIVQAPPGVNDKLLVDFGGGDVRVTDEANLLSSKGQCVIAPSGHTVHCPLGLVSALRIETGDGHDKIVNRLGGVGDGIGRFTTINAGPGNDTVIDDVSNANIDGGPGNDALTPGFGRDVIVGGLGVDIASYSDHNVRVTVKLDGLGFDGANQEFDDVTNDVENLGGTFYDDVLIGNASNNWLYGGGGNDILRGDGGNDLLQGGAGNDTIDGGLGTDTATYVDHGGAVRVVLRTGVCGGHIGFECDGLLLGTVENVIGGSGSDQLYGDDGANVLLGGSGNDELVGFGGNDTLIGEDGPSDRASGGLGVDSCQAEFVSLSCP